MTDNLAPCPHCSGISKMHRSNSIFAGQHYIDYPNQSHGFRIECEGKCHAMTCWWHEEAQAIKAWNTRTAPKVKDLVWSPWGKSSNIFKGVGASIYKLILHHDGSGSVYCFNSVGSPIKLTASSYLRGVNALKAVAQDHETNLILSALEI